MSENKTHWLSSPNKNYLGHWDLPNGNPVVLTIKSASWEEVKNPVLNTKDVKRVIRFLESDLWVKPFICNETNAKTIFKTIGSDFMEDSTGKKIKLCISKVMIKREEVNCLRVQNSSQSELDYTAITEEQSKLLLEAIILADMNPDQINSAYKISSISELPSNKFEQCMKRLEYKKNENN